MRALNKKIWPILVIATVFVSSVLFFHEASAQNSNCNVTSAVIRHNISIPNGSGDDDGDGETNLQEEFFIDSSPPFVYFDIQTTGCVDSNPAYDMQISLTERDGGADDDVDSIEQLDDWDIDVPSDTFTLVYIAGEDECELNGFPDCEYHIETWDGNSSADEWSTLNYSCDGISCLENWQYQGLIGFQQNHPQDSTGNVVTTPPNLATVGSEDYLAPLPGLAGQPSTLKGFLQGLFQVLIVIAGLSAMIMLVIGAITYLSTDAFSGKSSGKEMMQSAVFGLILVLGAWVVINTINPDLASNLSITIPRVQLDAPRPEWQGGNAPVGTNIAEGETVNNQPVTQGGAWPSDAAQRAQLAGAGITVHASGDSAQADGVADCTEGSGTPHCTSVYFEGNAAAVIQQIIDFKTACNVALAALPDPIPCVVKITGGSEAWLHGSHGPGKKIVDMSATQSLNRYLNSLPGGPPPGDNFPTGKSISISGVGKFKAEGAGDNVNTTAHHWHVRFY